jgi:hypothetical protein
LTFARKDAKTRTLARFEAFSALVVDPFGGERSFYAAILPLDAMVLSSLGSE